MLACGSMGRPWPRPTALGSGLHTHRTLRAPIATIASLALLTGCPAELESRLVQLRGCGLDGEEINGILVRVRGDLPEAEATQLLLADERSELQNLPDGARALTVEGRFGTQVEAVGRTARLEVEGELPVYFAPPDQLCPVESDITPRPLGAAGLGPQGDVLIVGGREPTGGLSAEILHYRDIEGRLRAVGVELPEPATGQSVHTLGGRRFAVVGGAGVGPEASDAITLVEAADDPATFELRSGGKIEVSGVPQAFAHHAGAVLPDGRILITGGCRLVDNGECIASPESVRRDAFYLSRDGDGVSIESAPSLRTPRFEHQLLVAADGVAFAVGGLDVEGNGVRDLEVLLPDFGSWAPYGPALFPILGDRSIAGATILAGGLVILSLTDGTIVRVDQHHAVTFPAWCEGEDDACFPSTVDTLLFGHRLLGLPGERVLADAFVLPVGLLGSDGSRGVDLSQRRVGSTYEPPSPRVGGSQLLLDDGTVLFVGGFVPASGAQPSTALLRFRPELDGPDEGAPDVGALESGSLVVHDVDAGDDARISGAAGVLALEPDPDRDDATVATWVHVRGFRSRRFVFEATLEAQREARPRFIFPTGAVARTVVAVEPNEVTVTTLEANGEGLEIRCSDTGIDFSGVGKPVRVDVSPEFIEVRSGPDDLARCPWTGDEDVAVGLGAVGDGTIRASGLGLSRG